MCQDILISLDREHSLNIIAGRKTVEVRRRPIRVEPGTRVWLYTKRPVAQIEAVATIAAIDEGTANELWTRFGRAMAISRRTLRDYMTDARSGCAMQLHSVSRLPRGVTLAELRKRSRGFSPPQFFLKLQPGSPALQLLEQRLGG